jgi:hypothetical protein
MVVVLPGDGVEFPRRTPKGGDPVVGRFPIHSVSPDIPVALGVVPARARLLEPVVLEGSVIEHQVQDDRHIPAVGAFQETAEIIHASIFGRAAGIVCHIIAHIEERRGVVGRKPDGIHPQVFQVVQPSFKVHQVTDAVAVAVSEAARVDLVEDGLLPPGQVFDTVFHRDYRIAKIIQCPALSSSDITLFLLYGLINHNQSDPHCLS